MRMALIVHALGLVGTLLTTEPDPPLRIPPALTVEAGRMLVVEAASVGPVRWAVFPRTPAGPDMVRIDDATGRKVAFVAQRPGTYTLFAATVADGQVSEFVECVIVVTGGAGPGPGPGPDPQPPPTPYFREFEAAWQHDAATGSTEQHLAALTAIYTAVAASTWTNWEALVDHLRSTYDRTLPPAIAVKLRAAIAHVLNTELYPRARSWDSAAAAQTLSRVATALQRLSGPAPEPEPQDPLWTALRAAWNAETASDKKDHAKRLAVFYRESAEMARTLQVPRVLDLHLAMIARRRTLSLETILPAVRQALTEEFNRSLPRETGAPLDQATRDKAASLFTRVAALLEKLP